MEKLNIAIIGGGMTGLVAAYRLAIEGHKVSIYERGKDVGGLANGFPLEGTHLEMAYHHLFKTDTDIIDLVKELGLEDKLQWHESSVAIYYDRRLYPFTTPVDLLRFSAINFLDRIRLAFVTLYLQRTNNWRQFINISAYEWMQKWCGANAMRVIWEPLLKGKFSGFYDKVSMAWLWARIHTRASSRDMDGKERLGYFDGGFNVLIQELGQRLKEKGVAINTQAEIQSISSGSKASIKVDGKKLEFDKVIATVPSTVFGFLAKDAKLDSSYLQQLNSINYLGAICLIFTSTQEISKFYWHNINDLQSPFLVFIHHTRLIDRKNYHGKYVYYIGTYLPHDHNYFEADNEQLAQEWFDYLHKIFPDFDKSKVDSKYVFKFKNAQHIVDLDYESKIPEYKTPLKDVYLSNFSQIFPEDRGTNFAVREGNKVAKLIF